MSKKTVVIHSGGMDSSICLALAICEFGRENVLSLGFDYGQRHAIEMERASEICQKWKVERRVISLETFGQLTKNALTDHQQKMETSADTLVLGRNGLMARLGAIQAHQFGADSIFMGVMEVENSGYRDCSREYMDLMEKVLRLDLDNPDFSIHTPLIWMTKKETMDLAYKLGVLQYLLTQTLSCYRGVLQEGCQNCPACHLRREGIEKFLEERPYLRGMIQV